MGVSECTADDDGQERILKEGIVNDERPDDGGDDGSLRPELQYLQPGTCRRESLPGLSWPERKETGILCGKMRHHSLSEAQGKGIYVLR